MKVKIVCEFLGTAFLVLIVIGSGIMGQNLFSGQAGMALFANSLATGAGLFVLIQCLGPISGAHMNPVVTLIEMFWGQIDRKLFIGYVLAQMSGAFLGVILTHAIFNMQIIQISEIDRSGSHLLLSEAIATFGLISTIALAGKKHVEFAPLSVAAYITSAYWFTSSTSFANPAITFARAFTNSFSGIAIGHYLPFVASQLVGALLAWVILKALPRT